MYGVNVILVKMVVPMILLPYAYGRIVYTLHKTMDTSSNLLQRHNSRNSKRKNDRNNKNTNKSNYCGNDGLETARVNTVSNIFNNA